MSTLSYAPVYYVAFRQYINVDVRLQGQLIVCPRQVIMTLHWGGHRHVSESDAGYLYSIVAGCAASVENLSINDFHISLSTVGHTMSRLKRLLSYNDGFITC